jgi:hypothetical protein
VTSNKHEQFAGLLVSVAHLTDPRETKEKYQEN